MTLTDNKLIMGDNSPGEVIDISTDVDKAVPKQIVNSSTDGVIRLRLGLPSDGKKRRFTYRLWKTGRENGKVGGADHVTYEKCVFLEQCQGCLRCKILLLETGQFDFQLFVRCSDLDGTAEETKVFSCCAHLTLTCHSTKVKDIFPCNQRKEWGPGQDLESLGVSPVSHTNATIYCKLGLAKLVFSTANPIQMLAELKSNKHSKQQLLRCVLTRVEKNQAMVSVRLPSSGLYALEVYAKPQNSSSTFPHICSYLLNAERGCRSKVQFPALANQKCGASEECTNMGLTPLSHTDSFFTCPEQEIQITFKVTQSSQFYTEMYRQTESHKEIIEDHIFIHQSKDSVSFLTRFPQNGLYLITLYAKPRDYEGILSCVYQYVAEVTKAMGVFKPFPKCSNMWGEGCTVKGLDEGYLPCNEDIPLAVTIPDAKRVVVTGNQWHYLQKDSERVWRGSVHTGAEGQDMKLCACFDQDTQFFYPLLDYKVKKKEDIQYELRQKILMVEMGIQVKKAIQPKGPIEIQQLQQELQEAIDFQNLGDLRRIMGIIETRKCKDKFKELLPIAKRLLASLERIKKLSVPILHMNQATMAEIRSYQSPPRLVHRVCVAMLLLLGEREEQLKDWKTCQTLCNTNDLCQKVKDYRPDRLDITTVSRSQALLKPYKIETIRATSVGAACFYAWVMGMIEEFHIISKWKSENIHQMPKKVQKTSNKMPFKSRSTVRK